MAAEHCVVLVSGGLDSATVLAIARGRHQYCHALSFDYGQRHRAELTAAAQVAQSLGACEHRVVTIGIDAIGGSALTDMRIAVPETPTSGIPVTYVPARNTVFLSLALGWAEVIGCADIYIGVNAMDYSGYPDCRPAFITAFAQLANLATRAGVEGTTRFAVHAPLMDMHKDDIIREGLSLRVDFAQTVSCYQADAAGLACGRCDSCRIRRDGFLKAGVADPTRYRSG
ncbi:MAG: 7-cyano-7-deazaguanine synthase QueC [Gammaproteobacteria bacterium]|nr:7-cyano-7-deazaguanine synthase QueC [Gammaproteobacteria bacterium]